MTSRNLIFFTIIDTTKMNCPVDPEIAAKVDKMMADHGPLFVVVKDEKGEERLTCTDTRLAELILTMGLTVMSVSKNDKK